jgi:hypothetical protein
MVPIGLRGMEGLLPRLKPGFKSIDERVWEVLLGVIIVALDGSPKKLGPPTFGITKLRNETRACSHY